MKTCSFITFGCKVNQYETQALREAIISSGYEETPSNVPVDLCVINTCTVTSTSDDKSRQQIRKVIRNMVDILGPYLDYWPQGELLGELIYLMM